MTSERWLRLLEVKPQDLPAFLEERKRPIEEGGGGYTVVAVEQAAASVGLETFRFPKRCVLLLGNEQNGVPASLFELVDACVEVSHRHVLAWPPWRPVHAYASSIALAPPYMLDTPSCLNVPPPPPPVQCRSPCLA